MPHEVADLRERFRIIYPGLPHLQFREEMDTHSAGLDNGSTKVEGNSMLVVSRREYKVMLDHRLFTNRKSAVEALWRELHACSKRLKGIEFDGEFNNTKKREIAFLDTKDHAISLNRFVFRQRTDLEQATTEYTLKCRSPDRYVAAGAEVNEGKGLKAGVKLEEDIGAPFVVRFSNSNTVAGPDKAPKSLKEAAKLFPVLGQLERDGDKCSGELELRPVNAIKVVERVLIGPILAFNKTEAEVALILWSNGSAGRPLVGEFSFRYAHDEEDYSTKAAMKAMEFFEELQRLDWCAPNSQTKTQYVYRTSKHDVRGAS